MTDSDTTLHAPTLAIVGVGLIGGSFAAALRAQGIVGRVQGVGRNPESLARAQEIGLIDCVVDAATAAREADIIVLAVPVGAMSATMKAMAPYLRDDTILTDVGSTKGDVVAAAREALGTRIGQFVPGHPIAGGEASGPDAAQPMLYCGKQVVLTPLVENSAANVDLITHAWQACGAKVCNMTPDEHDRVLGSVSHLPHLLSAIYMAQVAAAEDAPVRLEMAGSGFRDFTRIAAGSSEMWRDIYLANAQAVRAELGEVRALIDQMDIALKNGDGPALAELLEFAAQARRAWQIARETQ